MNKEKQLLEIIAEILEVDSVDVKHELDESTWDSLAIVTFISEIDSTFDLILEPAAVGEAKTVLDLIQLV